MKSKILYEKKILLNLEMATYDMVVAMSKKSDKKPNVNRTLREIVNAFFGIQKDK